MIDLHIHLGGAVPAAVLWEILCDSGLQTAFASFDDLQDYLTVQPETITSLDDFIGRYFHASEFIQSSPHAASTAIYQLVAKAYRRSKLDAVEIRFNPIKRLRRGLHTLDSIVVASLQGLQRASLHYPVRTGIIFSLGRELDLEDNWKILACAVKYARKGALDGAYGVVGLDLAGPESRRNEADVAWLAEAAKMVEEARRAGLGITWHVGETPDTGPELMLKALEHLRPDRIGHGIELRKATGQMRHRLLDVLRETKTCLEICPTVNMVTKSIGSYDEIAGLVRTLSDAEVPFCLNTDNPYLIKTNLRQEYTVMEQALGADAGLLRPCHAHAAEATFLR